MTSVFGKNLFHKMEDFLIYAKQEDDDVIAMEICTIDLDRKELLEVGFLQIGIYDVCTKRKVRTLEWLLKKYELTDDELHETTKAVIGNACVRNDLETAQIYLKYRTTDRDTILSEAGAHWKKIQGNSPKKRKQWDTFAQKLRKM